MISLDQTDIQIVELAATHIDSLVQAFAHAHWHKPAELFHRYHSQHLIQHGSPC